MVKLPLKTVKFKSLKKGLNVNPRVLIYHKDDDGGYGTSHFDIVYVDFGAKTVLIDSGYLQVISASQFDKQYFVYEHEFDELDPETL